MISLDTNVIVRVVTADEPEQLAIALQVMRSESLWLSKTVLLETEWVLRYSYKLSRETVLETFVRLLGYRNLSVEAPEQVHSAVELYRGGMDFADALHLAASTGADRFVTFDRELALAARKLDVLPAVEWLKGRILDGSAF
ncbi:MAG TPA: type II toxin-antitoxin system VapC family toxin [Thermoanaerobaculia bacterium]|nr:type II toxin-antitoxin system VapC family toxin [Thermoanaerobaculia bacterium]